MNMQEACQVLEQLNFEIQIKKREEGRCNWLVRNAMGRWEFSQLWW